MTSERKQILLVEDDEDIAEMVTNALGAAGYCASAVMTSDAVRAQLAAAPPDLIVLDVMLPGDNGFDIIDQVRTTHSMPIIMLTALAEVGDKVNALKLGADDYLAKPFNTQELLARIEAVLRRAQQFPTHNRDVLLEFDGWQLDTLSRRLVDPNGSLVLLTSAEFDLVRVLCEQAGQVLSRDKLVLITQQRQVEPYDRSIDTLISRIRQKIEHDPARPEIIKTVRNGGYVFALKVQEVIR
ncbi:two-component system OmpR family response regulator [Litoreibacter ponti]|uniref:Regulatory protein VirG n=1 Tax=Litoreibacter ponti TaxID=1510457 RepID=A0A2T6BCL0_9RHOB|nr:response regulator transcription factor [Litoreibacter ponti]PTX53801.1 two-component system OmpR family response regulator [Litoreibacter ponti]